MSKESQITGYNITQVLHKWTKEEREKIKNDLLIKVARELNCNPEELSISSFSMPNVKATLRVKGPIKAFLGEKI